MTPTVKRGKGSGSDNSSSKKKPSAKKGLSGAGMGSLMGLNVCTGGRGKDSGTTKKLVKPPGKKVTQKPLNRISAPTSGGGGKAMPVMPPTQEYQKLIKVFPLRPIESREQHKKAIEVSLDLGKKINNDDASKDEEAYFKVLGNLIEAFESQICEPSEKLTPVEMLRFLMDQHDLRQIDLEEEFGSQSLVSGFLCGKRELSKSQIRNLSERFGVSPSVFF